MFFDSLDAGVLGLFPSYAFIHRPYFWIDELAGRSLWFGVLTSVLPSCCFKRFMILLGNTGITLN
jgi:hypothetical protein